MWVMAVSAVPPCQCFTPGSVQMTSPAAMSCRWPPHSCTQPEPEVTISVWPAGWVCQAVLAHGVKETSAELKLRLGVASNRGLTVTSPVNVSAGPAPAGRESLREISTPAVPPAAPGVDFHSPSGAAADSTAAIDRIFFIISPRVVCSVVRSVEHGRQRSRRRSGAFEGDAQAVGLVAYVRHLAVVVAADADDAVPVADVAVVEHQVLGWGVVADVRDVGVSTVGYTVGGQ